MNEAKPLLFVDVDGVVCTFGVPEVLARNGSTVIQIGGFDQWVTHEVAENLLILEDHFECVWATAWFSRAPLELGAALGVGQDWPVLDWGAMKLPAMLEWAGTRRFAFIDDDIDFELSDFEGEIPETALLLAIAPNAGLTADNVATLINFATKK